MNSDMVYLLIELNVLDLPYRNSRQQYADNCSVLGVAYSWYKM